MKRKGTLTIPYTFCLLCGVIGLVLLMAATFATLAVIDIRAARPEQATRVLHETMIPVTRALNDRLDLPLRQLDLVRHWANRGMLDEGNPTEWPAVLLPALMHLPGLKSFALVRENGALCEVSRGADGWTGSGADPDHPDGALSRMAWDLNGYQVSKGGRTSLPADPRLDDWYQKTMTSSEAGHDSDPVMELGEGSMNIAVALNFPRGQRGCLTLTLDTAFLRESMPENSNVELVIDPGGVRLGQIQDAATRLLLEERAVPGESNLALARLFNSQPKDASCWYAVRSHTLSPSHVWWVIARVDAASLPLPALPFFTYAAWSMAAGLVGALLLALVFGRAVTQPLRQVAARARSIHDLDEHYLPWPRSRFTEVNVLTSALEDIYEAAVEHLDYHDAPLVTWAEPDAAPNDGMIEAEAVCHVFQFPRGERPSAGPVSAEGGVIEVSGDAPPMALPEAIPAAQLQVLQGTRKELRRLQSQLAGAAEELRTADNHFQQDLTRVKRQRNCLRRLESLLLAEGAASPALLAQVQDILAATRVSLWTAGGEAAQFHLAVATGSPGDVSSAVVAPFAAMSLLQSESLLTVQEPARDPRLSFLGTHPFFQSSEDPRMLAPVRMAGKLLGFFVVERSAGHGRWKSDEELFMLGIANACAGVLWHQMRRRAAATGVAFAAQIVVHDQPSTRPNGTTRKPGGSRRPAIANAALHWEIDRAGCIKSIEGDVEGLYGRSREQLIGQPITFLSEGEQGTRDMEQLARLLAGKPCRGYETIHQTADGAHVRLAVTAQVWRDASNRIIGARGTLEPVEVAAVAR